MVEKQPSLWKMHIFSHIFPNYTTTEHTWKPASTERDCFPCISPPSSHSHFSPMICSGLIKKHLRLSTQQPQKARERDTDDTSSVDTTKTADQWAEVDTLISQRKIWTPYACSNIITNTPDTRSYSNTNSLCAPTGTFCCSDVALSYSQQIAMTSQLHFIFQLWNYFYHFKH